MLAPMLRTAGLALVLLAPSLALAHHKQTPAVVRYTTAGNATLPRLADFSDAYSFAVPQGSSHAIYRFPYNLTKTVLLSAAGDPAHPQAGLSARQVVFDSDGDPLGSGDPGRQVYLVKGTTILQLTHDSTGTSVNPAINGNGSLIAFESRGDLAGQNSVGAQQVYVRNKLGVVTQKSVGAGASGNAAFSRSGNTLAFDSTTDPVTGVDTGVSQIWVADMLTGAPAHALTNGLASSRRPAVNAQGRIIAFTSTADLIGDGSDTGVSQVYVYDLQTSDVGRLTDDAGGCTDPSVDYQLGDWRVAFVCGGEAFFYQLVADVRYRVPIPTGANTSGILAQGGTFFLVVSTDADLMGSGTTPGHQIYQLNLYKLPAVPVPGHAVWSPERGVH